MKPVPTLIAEHRKLEPHRRAPGWCNRQSSPGPSSIVRAIRAGLGAVATAKSIDGLLSTKTHTFHWSLDPKKGRAVGGAFQVALPKGDLLYQSATYKVTGAKSYEVWVSPYPDGRGAIHVGKAWKKSGQLLQGLRPDIEFHLVVLYTDQDGKLSKPSAPLTFKLKDRFGYK